MTARSYFSERQRASLPRNVETVSEGAKSSLSAYAEKYVFNSGEDLVSTIQCGACEGTFTANVNEIERNIVRATGRKYDLEFDGTFPTDDIADIFDLIEIYYDTLRRTPYGIFGCFLLSQNRSRFTPKCPMKPRLSEFVTGINRVFEREKIAFELSDDGEIKRLGAPIVSDLIVETTFRTGDNALDELLETARYKFISRDPAVRKEGLDKLWDAWERLKTLEPGKDKKDSVSVLLDRVAQGPMRDVLESEALALRDIGNEVFIIRHTEVGKHPLDDDRHVDYLFHRMFSLVYLLLDGTGRLGAS